MHQDFICVATCILCSFLLCAGRGGLAPQPYPAQNANAARLAFGIFSVTSPMCRSTGCWTRNPVDLCCEDVVSLAYDKFSPSVSISNTLNLPIKYV